jgi:phenylalanyl-tRNA synthetase alpha chain
MRLLRSEDPRVVSQMKDLAPYRRVSAMPPLRRDLSIAVPVTVTVVRDLARTLTHAEANVLRDAVDAAVHEGAVSERACASRAS